MYFQRGSDGAAWAWWWVGWSCNEIVRSRGLLSVVAAHVWHYSAAANRPQDIAPRGPTHELAVLHYIYCHYCRYCHTTTSNTRVLTLLHAAKLNRVVLLAVPIV